MKKFFIIAVILVIAANVYYSLTYKGDIRTPYYEFKTRIGTAPLKTYRDTDFGYTISHPCMFSRKTSKEMNTRVMPASFIRIVPTSSWRAMLPPTIAPISKLAPILSPRSFIPTES